MAKRQSAYRIFHSTETALLRVSICYWTYPLQLTQLTVIPLIIGGPGSLDGLHTRYGISGTTLDWFQSYLVNRTQSVKTGNNSSAENEILYGEPQGSVI